MSHPYDNKRQDKVGKERAKQIAGRLGLAFDPPSENPQKNQFVEDKHGARYDNDTPNNWLRGGPNESAEGKPGFDGGKK